jgi:predicted permease
LKRNRRGNPPIPFPSVLALGEKAILAQSMVIGVATPTAVNTAILALQYDNEPEYASGIVYFTTLSAKGLPTR